MELYWKAIGAAMVAVLLGLMGKETGFLLSLAACITVGLLGLTYLRPVVEFLDTLQQLGGLQGELVEVLLKALGIGMITELTALNCRDGGNSSLGQAVERLGCGVILWLSIPLFTALMEVIQKILGEL